MNHQVVGDGSTGLSSRDLAALRASLEEQRRFRRDQLREIAVTPPGVDGGTRERAEASRTEVEIKLAASARMVLDDVEAALERMDRGRYGICHRCERPIPRAHLGIVPQARCCARCRQVAEIGERP